MDICKECGSFVGDNGLTEKCGNATPCERDAPTFYAEVERVKSSIDLHALARMERNEMPACFQATRAATVAMARLLMESLRQTEELVKHIPKH